MITLVLTGHSYGFEMELVTRIFYPYEKIEIIKEDTTESARPGVGIVMDGKRLTVKDENPADEETERRLGLLLFKLLANQTSTNPVWGMLTGIRPVRLCGKWREQGASNAEILRRLTQDYLAAEEKARLCLQVLDAQRGIVSQSGPETFSLYVGIPFCPTRCRYCSFVSHAIDRAGKLLPEYLRLLLEEIRLIGENAKNMRPLSVYIGGGTPTVLYVGQLTALMSQIRESFDISNLLEYTVEAGRADTITAEKLAAIKAMGAGRISVNPQSMTPRVLEAIGRSHTPEDVERGFYLAREAGFDWINMDIIAGLPEETPESFAGSLERILALSPENITVHALALKRSSEMRIEINGGEGPGHNTQAAEMQRYAAARLKDAGYIPYYLYRQKPAVENLENTGYTKPGFEAAYNIYSMDDAHNILAAGAGAVSKLICADGKIKRVFNHKYPYEYISRFDEIMSRKGEFA
jgi:oxygen-independent coproporphyrinogen-3 oxidase